MHARILAAAGLLAATPALGQNIDTLGNLNQAEFRLLSEDLGAAVSYKPIVPTTPLGITGFDLGLAVSVTQIQNQAILDKATSDNAPSSIVVPTLRFHKGLPLGIDFGLVYSQIPDSDIKYYGGEVRWAFIQGDMTTPAIAVRGAFTKVSGVTQMDLDTKSIDISISKGFTVLTPYGGIGQVWVNSDPKGNGGLTAEEFSMTKYFFGVGFNFALMNLVLEADKTGDAVSYSVKAGLRF